MPTNAKAIAHEQDPSEPLKAAGEIIKLSTSLATGALVFSVGLLANATSYLPFVRWTLCASWVFLVFSVISGIISQASIPVLLFEKNYSLESPTYTWPGRIHQVLFVVAILTLAGACIEILFAEPAPTELSVPDAARALTIAENQLIKKERICKVEAIDLVKGADQTRISLGTWHVQLQVADAVGPGCSSPSALHADFFVRADDGAASKVER